MSIFKFIELINRNKSIHVFGNGEQTRSFTYIDDVVEGIINAIELKGFEIINLGNNKRYSLNYLIRVIEKGLNKKAILKFEEANRLDMPDTLPDIQKANKLLNWNPKIDLEEGISKTISWHIENKEFAKNICL
jgi:nucleoside-diphosphate-sugar epimerase